MSMLSRLRGSKGYGACRDAAPTNRGKAPRDKREYSKRKAPHRGRLSFWERKRQESALPERTKPAGRFPSFSGELESENMRESLLGTSPPKGIALSTALLYNTLINQ